MKFDYDIQKLEHLLDAFYGLTKVTITLFDHDLKPIASAGEWKAYCLAIGNSEIRLSLCEACNRKNAKISEDLDDDEIHIYACHAGIAEAVAPIRINKQVAAYLMIGKFHDVAGIYSSPELVEDAARRYKMDKDSMLTAYADLPLLDQTSMNRVIMFFKAIICYIRDLEVISIDSPQVKAISKYIDEHFREKITMKTLCRVINSNRNDFYRLFKQNFNESLDGYINNKRIEYARKLLVTTDMKIQNVMEEVGIKSYAYFFKLFKEKTGMSPREYRFKYKNETKTE